MSALSSDLSIQLPIARTHGQANAVLLKAGLVDEVSLLTYPCIDTIGRPNSLF